MYGATEPTEQLQSSSEARATPALKRAISREIQILRELPPHQGIVQLLEVLETPELHGTSLEFEVQYKLPGIRQEVPVSLTRKSRDMSGVRCTPSAAVMPTDRDMLETPSGVP